ncbi:MAG: dipeptide epimerase [Verrucomicrobia bacterium]|nr:dipeptide epimerase [Verrucomicrobiota bacterium]
MQMKFQEFDLKLTHRWTIASSLGPGGAGGTEIFKVVFVELRDKNGVLGIGEAAPSTRYERGIESVLSFLRQVDADRLSFDDLSPSMEYLDGLGSGHFAAKGALNIALLDGAARLSNKPVCDYLGLGFTERKHVTSFSIGIDHPDSIRRKVAEAESYPVLKLKVGSPQDRQNLAALREIAPQKPIRVDANEAWKTKEEALGQLEWLAGDGAIQFAEQPMPATSAPRDLAWLKERTPLPIMADESCLSANDIELCADCYHAVNVKLMKTGGISGAVEALKAARTSGMKTMIGCMIESSVLITAAAHLAELTDYLDIDGNLLISNDPFLGATAEGGIISFAKTPEPIGLRVQSRDPLADRRSIHHSETATIQVENC